MRESELDLAIVGGGVMGLYAAVHLLELGAQGVAVFERDPLYRHASSALSAGGVRDLLSSEVNIALAVRSLQDFRDFPARTATSQGPGPDIGLRSKGYLFLTNAANEADFLRRAELQERLGAAVRRLDRGELARRYPELRADDLTGAILGPNCGYLDAYQVLRGLRAKALDLGALIVEEEVTSIGLLDGRAALVESSGSRIRARRGVVDAAGAWAGEVGALAGVEVPVRPWVRQLYLCQPPDGALGDYPFVADPGGLYFRPEPGGRILVGKALPDDPWAFCWDWQRERFLERIWPDLAARVPALERLRLEGGWAGVVEQTPDGSGLIGEHPDLAGFYLLAGFSGLGIMLAPAAGRALAEIVLGRSPTVDVAALSPGRFAAGRQVEEERTI